MVDRALVLGVTDGQVTLLGEADLAAVEEYQPEPAVRREAVTLDELSGLRPTASAAAQRVVPGLVRVPPGYNARPGNVLLFLAALEHVDRGAVGFHDASVERRDHVGLGRVLEKLEILLALGSELLDARPEAEPGDFQLLELLRHSVPLQGNQLDGLIARLAARGA